MSLSDQKAWTGQVHDYMDIDAVEQVMEEQRIKKIQEERVNNFAFGENRVILPGNRINWAQVDSPNALIIA